MSRVKHQIRLDFSSIDLAALQTEDDFHRAARMLLPAALEELGQAMGEAAWTRLHASADKPPIRLGGTAGEMRRFVREAGRKYKRHAPAVDRQSLEDVIVRRLKEAKASAGTKEGGSTVAK